MRNIIIAVVSVLSLVFGGAALAGDWDSLINIPGDNNYTGVSSTGFTDVGMDHHLYNGIRVAELEGWFAGYPDGTLKPDQVITAEQIAIVVDRLFPDGATRAEVATFISAGYAGLLEGNIVIEASDMAKAIYVHNLGSFPIDLNGMSLMFNNGPFLGGGQFPISDYLAETWDGVLMPEMYATWDMSNVPSLTSAELYDRYGLDVASTGY